MPTRPAPTSLIPHIPGISDGIESAFNTILDSIMKAIWSASVWLLRSSLELVDSFLAFDNNLAGPDGKPAAGAPFAMLWPTLTWIAGAIALGLFFWQLAVTVLRGGVGFWRVASGPVAFGVACALSLGVVTALLGGADGLTTLLLQKGLSADNFAGILDSATLGKVFTDTPPDLGDQIDGTARSVLLGIVSVFGVIPAGLGYLLEMIFRQAVILVLVATLPITAAGMMTNTTSSWFWRALRWTIAAIILKPALALVLVIGVNMLGQPTGIGGLLAGAGVLLVSLFCPLAVFRLLAFVEPGTAAGATFRSGLSGGSSGSSSSGAADGGSSAEDSNTSRFDSAGSAGGSSSGSGSSGGSSGGGLSQLGGMVGGAAAAAASFGNAQMDGAGIGWGYGGPASAGNSNSQNQNQDRSQQDPNSSRSGDGSSDGSGGGPVDGGLPVSPDAATQAIAPPTPAGGGGGSPVGAGSSGPGGGGPGGGGAAVAADVPPVA